MAAETVARGIECQVPMSENMCRETGQPRKRRWFKGLHSLRAQMAVGSALVALLAVLVVTITAVLTVAVSFNHYQSSLLANDTSTFATAYGQDSSSPMFPSSALIPTPNGQVPLGGPFVRVKSGSAYIWIMNGSGQVFTPPAAVKGQEQTRATFAQDEPVITAALQSALHGQSSEGILPGESFPSLAERFYAAAPVHQGGVSSGRIVGAIALSTPPRAEHSIVFTFLSQVNTTVLLASLGVALLAALVAIAFSRRLTRPLTVLDAATARMAGGDYAARVTIESPSEYQHLASSFNEMAAALERDIGEIHRQEHQRRELVANVSHELATPLTAIEGFTEALADGVVHDPAAREETVRTIAREAARLHRLVDQLRQVSLFEVGAHVLERSPLDLSTLIAETLAVLTPELEQKRVTLLNHLPDGLPLVYADGDRVTEILLNLLDNALHHTPPHGSIEVSGAPTDRAVRLTIANTGATIPPEQRERIFERFYRADSSRATATGGSGLGLAIVKALVEAHGGAIWVDEQPGGGTRFSFTLPIAA